MLGSGRKWADLRVLIEKGFDLSGAPIAKMEPLEERLWFAKKQAGRYATVARKAKTKRGKPKVITAQVTGVGAQKTVKKKKSSRYRGGS